MASCPTCPSAVSACSRSRSPRRCSREERLDLVAPVAPETPRRSGTGSSRGQERRHADVVGEQRLRQRLRDRRAGERIAGPRERRRRPSGRASRAAARAADRPCARCRAPRNGRGSSSDSRRSSTTATRLASQSAFMPGHHRVQAQRLRRACRTEPTGIPMRDAQRRVERVGVGDDGVQAVVASHELQHDERAVRCRRRPTDSSNRAAPGDRPPRHHGGHGHEPGRAEQEVASAKRPWRPPAPSQAS